MAIRNAIDGSDDKTYQIGLYHCPAKGRWMPHVSRIKLNRPNDTIVKSSTNAIFETASNENGKPLSRIGPAGSYYWRQALDVVSVRL